MISLEEGKKLLQLAKNAVLAVFDDREVSADEYCQRKFAEKQGCFVTLHRNGELRGCIGFPEPIMPLHQAIVQAAQAAAFEDPRFSRLERTELKEVSFEISILTKPRLIEVKKPEEYLEKVSVGRDGLIIRGLYGSGLLLPQVATEWKWGCREFLEHTCLKAGLDREAWKDLRNKVYAFQAQIFAEEKGKVVEKEIH
jgi:uncharacterized protein (TIGR00296 family)